MNATTTMSAPVVASTTAKLLDYRTLVTMSRVELTQVVYDRFQENAPKSWNRDKMALAYIGTNIPAGGFGKRCAQWHFKNITGTVPAKSWTLNNLNAKLSGDVINPSQSKGTKDALVIEYVTKMGCMPAKTWTIAVLNEKFKAGVKPARGVIAAQVVGGKVVVA